MASGSLPGSLSTLCCVICGAELSGPGVPPTEPGDLVSSLPGPEYESDDDGGRCQSEKSKIKHENHQEKHQASLELPVAHNTI